MTTEPPKDVPLPAVLRYIRDGRHRSVLEALEGARADLDVLLAKTRADHDPTPSELLSLSQRIADAACTLTVIHAFDNLLRNQ